MQGKRRAARIADRGKAPAKVKRIKKTAAAKKCEKLPPFKLDPDISLERIPFNIKKYVHSARLDKELILKVKGEAQLIVYPVFNQLPYFSIEIGGFKRAKAWTLDQALKLFDKHKNEVW